MGANLLLFVGAGVAAVWLASDRRLNVNRTMDFGGLRLILLFEAVPHYQFLFIFIQNFVLPCLSIKHFSSIKALEDDCSRFNARKMFSLL